MRNVGRSSAASVLLVGLDPESLGMVRETLAAEAVLPNNAIPYEDALDIADAQKPDVAIVDYTADMDTALALGQAMQKEMPNIALVALAKQSDASAILAAMRVGYKEFVVLPDDAQRLRQVVHDAAFTPADDDEKGLVIAFVGAKGGVGNTILATHLAAELAAIHRVLVIDADFGTGDVASVMDLTPKDTIDDLIPRADRLDERGLTGAVAVHRSKVHVLATPSDIDRIGEVRADDMYNIINTAAKAYQFVVIDCGVYVDEAVTIAVQVADIVVMVTTPDVPSVRNAFRRLKHFETLGVEKDRIKLVVNKWHKGAYVTLADIRQNLQAPVVATISYDDKTVEQAVNEGKLIRDVNRKSDVANEISELVAALTEDADGELPEDDNEKPSGGGGFFASLFGRS